MADGPPSSPETGGARKWDAVDLCAGAGGWEEGAPAGLRIVGIELDGAACATRAAAGHETVTGDIALLDPLDFAGVRGVIASPPCPTFSAGGRGAGRLLTDVIVRCMAELAAGNDARQVARDEAYALLEAVAWADEQAKAKKKGRVPNRSASAARARRDADMSLLVVEPLRWVIALEPEWVALEQVPEALGLWSYMAQRLGVLGYGTWAGILEAERYGVPQTRTRAILMARRGAAVHPPRATHQRYVIGEAARHEVTLEGELLPWISMEAALGRGMAEMTDTGNTRGGTRNEGRTRVASSPAMTVTSRADQLEWRTHYNARDQKDGKTGKPNRLRSVLEPAPTIAGESRNDSWMAARPATTVQGDSRIWPPGHKKNADDERAGRDGYGDRAGTGAVRVTVGEAAALQGFRADYPWQGTRGQQFKQIGNAVPPPLGGAVLGELVEVGIKAAELLTVGVLDPRIAA